MPSPPVPAPSEPASPAEHAPLASQALDDALVEGAATLVPGSSAAPAAAALLNGPSLLQSLEQQRMQPLLGQSASVLGDDKRAGLNAAVVGLAAADDLAGAADPDAAALMNSGAGQQTQLPVGGAVGQDPSTSAVANASPINASAVGLQPLPQGDQTGLGTLPGPAGVMRNISAVQSAVDGFA